MEPQKRNTIFTTELHRGARRKIPLSGTRAVLCHRFALIDADPEAKPEAMKSDSEVQDHRFHDLTTFIELDHVRRRNTPQSGAACRYPGRRALKRMFLAIPRRTAEAVLFHACASILPRDPAPTSESRMKPEGKNKSGIPTPYWIVLI
jgi:hypothetical protein